MGSDDEVAFQFVVGWSRLYGKTHFLEIRN
jgi:hypothetical protein